MHVRRDFRWIMADLAVLIGGCPLAALAGPSLALPALAACDGQSEPDLTTTPLSAQDPAVTRLIAAIDQSFDSALAHNILSSVKNGQMMADGPAKPRPPRRGTGYILKTAQAPPASPGLAALANPSFGESDAMAISIRPRLVPSGALNTDIRLSHSGEYFDAGFNLAAQHSLIAAEATAMRYDGQALVKFGPAMQLGVAASGTLGTVGAPTLAGQEMAGPLLHLKLIDRNLSLVTDMGYDFGLNPPSATARNQFHAKLDLKLKL